MPETRGATAPLPREVYFEVTNRCNLLCETCPRTFVELEPAADLSIDRMIEIADQLPDLERVILHGVGEPLLNRELPRMIAYASGRGATVMFNTNGTLLTERRGDAITEAGLDALRVSLDAATPATYLRVRGANVLPKILRNVAAFTERRADRGETNPHVSVWATVLRENLEEMPDLVRLAAQIGASEVNLQRLVYNELGLAVAEQSIYRDLSARQAGVLDACREVAAKVGIALTGSGGTHGEGAFGQPESNDQEWRSCRRPWKVLYVTAHGTMLPCCIAPFATTDMRAIVLGDVITDGVAKTWNGDVMRSFRTRHQSDDPPVPCAPCGAQWSL